MSDSITHKEPTRLAKIAIYNEWLTTYDTSGSVEIPFPFPLVKKRVSDKLRAMAEDALMEHRAGQTEVFPE